MRLVSQSVISNLSDSFYLQHHPCPICVLLYQWFSLLYLKSSINAVTCPLGQLTGLYLN